MPLRDFAEQYPHLVEHLRQARRNNRVAHAYMFTGDHFERLTEFSLAWVQNAVCRTRDQQSEACGVCANCQQVNALSYPYLHQVRPQSKSRLIVIEQVRELERVLNLKTGGEVRAALLLEADRMNIQAQNAFLKTLEEPAPNTLLILVTVSPSSLLPTIRSRCQIVSVLDNRLCYDFPGQMELFRALSGLRRGQGALAAMPVTEEILMLLKAMAENAKLQAETYLAERKAKFQELQPAMRKTLEAESQAWQNAQYLGQRETVLSALHTWFSQEFLRANGVDAPKLPNPEIYQGFPGDLPDPPSVHVAAANLSLVDDLLRDLRYNVDERLTLQNFCQRVCAKD